MKKFKNGIIYHSGNADVLNLDFKEGCFVFMKVDERSCSFYVDTTKMSERIFKVKLKSSVDYLKEASDKIDVKVLCSPRSKMDIQTVFSHYTFKSCVLSIRESSAEVIYYPGKNKVRISKSEKDTEKINVSFRDESVVIEPKKVKVLIVDDSKTIRNILEKIFSSDSELQVVASAEKPSEVEDLLIKHRPDVITLDIHMPEMDGVTLLKKLLPKYHIPTIMISSISMEEGPMVLNAIEAGAIDYIQKPSFDEIESMKDIIIEKVKAANNARVSIQETTVKDKVNLSAEEVDFNSLICIGSSTGGTEALRKIFVRLPDHIPPVLVVQHIPPVFSKAFAERMDSLVKFKVKEAEQGDVLQKNTVYIAPGGIHLGVNVDGDNISVRLSDDPPVNRFKPSVDFMFNEVSEKVNGKNLVSVILTGMGKDGAQGMLKLKQKGASTIAQDEDTCIVFGMPKEAIEIGAASVISPLTSIAKEMVGFFSKKGRMAS